MKTRCPHCGELNVVDGTVENTTICNLCGERLMRNGVIHMCIEIREDDDERED